MTKVQDIYFKTKKGLMAYAQIEKINDECFEANIHMDNSKGDFYDIELSRHSSAKQCFEELVNSIQKKIKVKFKTDSLEIIDNICNCDLITKKEERKLINSSLIQIWINGK